MQIAVLRSGLVSRTTHKFQAFTVFRTLYTDSQLGFLVPLYTLLEISTVYTTLHFPAARHMGPYDHEPPYKPSTRVCSSVREVPPALPGRVPI